MYIPHGRRGGRTRSVRTGSHELESWRVCAWGGKLRVGALSKRARSRDQNGAVVHEGQPFAQRGTHPGDERSLQPSASQQGTFPLDLPDIAHALVACACDSPSDAPHCPPSRPCATKPASPVPGHQRLGAESRLGGCGLLRQFRRRRVGGHLGRSRDTDPRGAGSERWGGGGRKPVVSRSDVSRGRANAHGRAGCCHGDADGDAGAGARCG